MISNNFSDVNPNNPSNPVAQQTITSLDAADIATSYQRPVVQSGKQDLILTPNHPNHPIVTKMMCDEYSPYLICTFNSTINYIENATEEKTFMEIKKMPQMNDRLILQESLIRRLEAIYETDYYEIESKIIEMTMVKSSYQTEEEGLISSFDTLS